MRSPVALSAWISLLVLATIGSLAVKDALASAPQVELSGKTNAAIAAALREQGFAVRVERHRFQSWIFFGTRGACRIAARDAVNAAHYSEAFREQMARVGSVRYLYRGNRSAGPPELTALVYRLVPRSLDRFGLHIARNAPVAVATSGGCPDGDFGLDRMTVAP
ncbi:hypothetical protein [Sphingomonas sp.]|uniref:hypothetical protein n=1 Tax=Sphingomonas sp. TaxID=28214 RepID=UPI00334282EC